jgi:lipopolysaccharide/colanic/teichoic acid biosynthesis glycosyltransferase
MIRRAIDIVVSAFSFLLAAPLLGGIAALLFFTQGRPIIFRQSRAGKDGVPFNMLKFRTMLPLAEQQGGSLTFGADPRITPIGAFLRNYKFDELPQLLNVLRGDMTIIGPRPEVLDWVAKYTTEQKRVLRVKPGLTDPVQLTFRNEQRFLSSAEEYKQLYAIKVEKQLQYIETRSGISDLRVVFSTLKAIFDHSVGEQELSVYSAIKDKVRHV